MCQRCSADILHCQKGRNRVGGVCAMRGGNSKRTKENKQKRRAKKQDRKEKAVTETPTDTHSLSPLAQASWK